jgi:hypothetical protein
MSPWFAAWLAWGASFAVVEGLALLQKDRKKPDTLSEHIWMIRDKVPFGKIGVAGFMLWLSLHFVFGGH